MGIVIEPVLFDKKRMVLHQDIATGEINGKQFQLAVDLLGGSVFVRFEGYPQEMVLLPKDMIATAFEMIVAPTKGDIEDAEVIGGQ